MRSKKKVSIKSRMIGMLLAAWFVPFVLIAAAAGIYVSGNHFDTQIAVQQRQLEFNSSVCAERLNQLITAAKSISYDRNLEKAYREYLAKESSLQEFQSIIDGFLTMYYGRGVQAKSALLWFWEDPKQLSGSIYNEKLDGSYAQIKKYWKNDHAAVARYAETLDTKAGFWNADGEIYLVRNLLDTKSRKMGVLVLCICRDYCFGNFLNSLDTEAVTIRLDDCVIPLLGTALSGPSMIRDYETYASGYSWKKDGLRLFRKRKENDYRMEVLMHCDDSTALFPFYGYQFILGGMLVLLVPLLAYVIHTFNNHISAPVNELMRVSKEIRDGQLGIQLSCQPDTREFSYLVESFNEMSAKLEEQFAHIYKEELALRDARIMALQSHINPHFMNNTLEIINWEARLSGSPKVSKMIEALSTLMDATLDRKKRPEVRLSEEMQYVNAYLYILSERFGKRLTVDICLPEDIMQLLVPRLVLQPLIENAIEHGASKRTQCTVEVRGWQESGCLVLEISNDGELSEQQQEKIGRLLSPGYDTSREPSGSMGIANVNQRLHILYGDPAGLAIRQQGGKIVTRVTILTGNSRKI